MKSTRILLALSLFALPVLASCGSDPAVDADPYDTFQLCWDDHHVGEAFPVDESISICCLDHPIGGIDANVVCGATQTACEAYVDASLTAGDATPAEVTAGCAAYITERGM